MVSLPKDKGWITLLLALGLVAFLVTEIARERPQDGVEQTLRHFETALQLRQILPGVEGHLEAIREGSQAGQVCLMQTTADLIKQALQAHAEAEEALLDRTWGRDSLPVPAGLAGAFRHECDLLRLWGEELEKLANAAMPDPHLFLRRAERLLGLIEAHVGMEEDLLSPILEPPPLLSRRIPLPPR